jgi:CheY-like chemotaxis protein
MPQSSILVVEDNPDEVQLICEALVGAGVRLDLRVAGSIDEAWSLLNRAPEDALPVLVITDHHLPDDRGQALIARMRASPACRRVPVVMVSGDDVRPADLGTTPWFGKPDTWTGWRALAQRLIGLLAPP